MSRVFELLKQTEIETDVAADIPSKAEIDRSVVKGVVLRGSGNYFDEEIARLVQTMFFSANSHRPRRVVFCGVDDAANGSAVVCASAGRALAARRESVCLLDANVRGPRLSKMFDVDESDIFSPETLPVRDRCVQVGSHLSLAGSRMVMDETGSLMSVTELQVLLARLQAKYGTILIDAPGTSASRDAALLGQLADAAILVIEANRTRKIAARKAKEFLERAGVQLIGTVLNNRSFPIPERLYKRL